MSCVFRGFDVQARVEKLQSLLAMEAHLDEEMDELERVYQLDQIKCDWLMALGHPDLCDVIRRRMQKADSLLKMYRPMLEDTCAEKEDHIRLIMSLQNQQQDDSHRMQQQRQHQEQVGLRSTLEGSNCSCQHQHHHYCSNTLEQHQQHTHVSQQHCPLEMSSPEDAIATNDLEMLRCNVDEGSDSEGIQRRSLTQDDTKSNQRRGGKRKRRMVGNRLSCKLKQSQTLHMRKLVSAFVFNRFHHTDASSSSKSPSSREIVILTSSKGSLHTRSTNHGMCQGTQLHHIMNLHFRPKGEPKNSLIYKVYSRDHNFCVITKASSKLQTEILIYQSMDKRNHWPLIVNSQNQYSDIMKKPIFNAEIRLSLDQNSIENHQEQEISRPIGNQNVPSIPTSSELQNEDAENLQDASIYEENILLPPLESEFYSFITPQSGGRE